MTTDILLVFTILTLTIALFISDKLRLDVVAAMAMLALMLTGILSPQQALAGFSDPVVLIIAGLFVVSGGLFRTGVASRVGDWLGRVAGKSEVRLVILSMLVPALFAGFMTVTGTVAVMLPIIVTLAWRANISPSKLLIPLAFGALLGAMLTLIGTPPNIIVSQRLAAEGLEPLRFFDFTPLGAAMLTIGLLFMLFVGRHLLPSRAPANPSHDDSSTPDTLPLKELAETYRLTTQVRKAQLPYHSPLVGQSLAEAQVRSRYRVNVLAMQSAGEKHPDKPYSRSLLPDTRIEAHDILYLQGDQADIDALTAAEGLEPLDNSTHPLLLPVNLGLVEVLLTPRSSLLGQTLREFRFRERYRLTVVSIKRFGEVLTGDISDVSLRFGDTLLVKGPWAHIEMVQREARDFVVVAKPPKELTAERMSRRAPLAIGVVLAMLVLLATGALPNVVSVLLAALAMVLLGCIRMEDAYRTINWQSVVLIAAMLPMATALEVTGAVELIVSGLLNLGIDAPMVMMGTLFALTSLFSQVISNTATTVLIAPIAFQLATNLGVSPYPFLLCVALAASTAFSTPIASPGNTIVLGPGNYRFGDFFKIGVVMQLLVMIATLLLVPVFFPF